MVFNFEDIDGFRSVELDDNIQYLIRTDGKRVIKLQRQQMDARSDWFGPESVSFSFPNNIAVFPMYMPKDA